MDSGVGAQRSFLHPSIKNAGEAGFSPWLPAAAVSLMKPILPYALSFTAGAMIFVVVEELIPESQLGEKHRYRHYGNIAWIYGNDGAGCGPGVNSFRPDFQAGEQNLDKFRFFLYIKET